MAALMIDTMRATVAVAMSASYQLCAEATAMLTDLCLWRPNGVSRSARHEMLCIWNYKLIVDA